jgi:hypothetical protein
LNKKKKMPSSTVHKCSFNFQQKLNYSVNVMKEYFNDFCDPGEYFINFVLSEDGTSLSFVTNASDIRGFVDCWNTGQHEEQDNDQNMIISFEVDGQLFDD